MHFTNFIFLFLGPEIYLSPDVLPTVEHFDGDCADMINSQVLPNLKKLNFEFDTKEIAEIWETSEDVALDYSFGKLLDVLNGMKYVEHIRVEVNLHIRLFDRFAELLSTVLNGQRQPNCRALCRIEIMVKPSNPTKRNKYAIKAAAEKLLGQLNKVNQDLCVIRYT